MSDQIEDDPLYRMSIAAMFIAVCPWLYPIGVAVDPYSLNEPQSAPWLAEVSPEGDMYVHVDFRRQNDHGPLRKVELAGGVTLDIDDDHLHGVEIPHKVKRIHASRPDFEPVPTHPQKEHKNG